MLISRSIPLGIALSLGAILAPPPSVGEACETIRFARGSYTGSVKGIAPAEDSVCYQLTTAAGQRAEVSVSGRNVIFTIGDLVDAQDSYSFTIEKKTYKIYVGQLMRSVTPEPFSLTVTVR